MEDFPSMPDEKEAVKLEELRSDPDILSVSKKKWGLSLGKKGKLAIGASMLLLLTTGAFVYSVYSPSDKPGQEKATMSGLVNLFSSNKDTNNTSKFGATLATSPTPTPSPTEPSPLPTPTPAPENLPEGLPTPTTTSKPVSNDVGFVEMHLEVRNHLGAFERVDNYMGNASVVKNSEWSKNSDNLRIRYVLSNIGDDTAVGKVKVLVNGAEVNSFTTSVEGKEVTTTEYTNIPTTSSKARIEAQMGVHRNVMEVEIKTDTTAPTGGIRILQKAQSEETCVTFYPNDDYSDEYEMTYMAKLDDESWKSIKHRPDPSVEYVYERCLTGPAGEDHTFYLKTTDAAGNTGEESKTFSLRSF